MPRAADVGPPCGCGRRPRLIALTGGPGAGKTAILEVVRRTFGPHVVVVREAATILFSGGFPRRPGEDARRAAQRAIFHVQRELEAIALAEAHAALIVCDRGTIDGQAYWPGSAASFWTALGVDRAAELRRYDAVLHARTPSSEAGFDRSNPLRIESAEEAARIDAAIAVAWQDHPRRSVIDASFDFLAKVEAAVAAIRAELPPACRQR